MSYYRARYYDSNVGKFLNEDPIRFGGGVNFYAYVDDDPTNALDPSGLSALRNSIQLHYTPDIDQACGGNPLRRHASAGACTIAQAILMCSCECSGAGWKARAELRLYGDMYVFNGTWPYRGRQPIDPTVHDPQSAIAHENSVHIDPAIASVSSNINKLENRAFKTQRDCEGACRKTANSVHHGFAASLAESQREESLR